MWNCLQHDWLCGVRTKSAPSCGTTPWANRRRREKWTIVLLVSLGTLKLVPRGALCQSREYLGSGPPRLGLREGVGIIRNSNLLKQVLINCCHSQLISLTNSTGAREEGVTFPSSGGLGMGIRTYIARVQPLRLGRISPTYVRSAISAFRFIGRSSKHSLNICQDRMQIVSNTCCQLSDVFINLFHLR